MSKATTDRSGRAAIVCAVTLLSASLGVALPDAAEAGADRPDAAAGLRANSQKDSTLKRETAPIAPKEKSLEARQHKLEAPGLSSKQIKDGR